MNYAEIILGGKERRLKYDYNAICMAEERSGKTIIQLLNENQMSFSAIRVLLFAGLLHQERNLTLDRVGVMMNEYLNKGKLEDLLLHIIQGIKNSGLFNTSQIEREEELPNE